MSNTDIFTVTAPGIWWNMMNYLLNTNDINKVIQQNDMQKSVPEAFLFSKSNEVL